MDPAERFYLDAGLVFLSIFVFVVLAIREKANGDREYLDEPPRDRTLYDALKGARKRREERVKHKNSPRGMNRGGRQ